MASPLQINIWSERVTNNNKTYNAADENQVKVKTERRKNERELELEDIKEILTMKTGAGIRFFRRLMEEGSIFSTTFTGNSQTFFLEGHRNLALKFFTDVCEAAPNLIPKIMIKDENDNKNS